MHGNAPSPLTLALVDYLRTRRELDPQRHPSAPAGATTCLAAPVPVPGAAGLLASFGSREVYSITPPRESTISTGVATR